MKKLLLGILIFFALFGIVTLEQWFLMPPSVRAQTNTFCAANLACTVTAAWTFSNALTVSGVTTFTGAQTVGKWNGNCIVDGIANATLAAAVTCAGSSGVIEIPMFAVPALTGSVTIPIGVTLRFDGPSGITTTGFTLTINGP